MPDTPPPISYPVTATLDINEWHAILARLDWDTMYKENVWTAYVARKIREQINGDSGVDRERGR